MGRGERDGRPSRLTPRECSTWWLGRAHLGPAEVSGLVRRSRRGLRRGKAFAGSRGRTTRWRLPARSKPSVPASKGRLTRLFTLAEKGTWWWRIQARWKEKKAALLAMSQSKGRVRVNSVALWQEEEGYLAHKSEDEVQEIYDETAGKDRALLYRKGPGLASFPGYTGHCLRRQLREYHHLKRRKKLNLSGKRGGLRESLLRRAGVER